MQLTSVRIRNFRSIEELTLPLDDLTVVCGPNSCGKSNVMRAVQFALQENINGDDVSQNITQWKIGPRSHIHIELFFSNCDPALKHLAAKDGTLRCIFKFYRSGTATRLIGGSNAPVDFDTLLKKFQIVYVPPIRDLNAGGLEPFRKLLKEAILRTRGAGRNVNGLRGQAEELFKRKSRDVLSQSTTGVSKLLDNSKIELDFSSMDVGSLAAQISLKVKRKKVEVSLSAVGTGHQSTVIMDLYKQVGQGFEGSLLFLFEEPDNHLHPSTIRCVAEDFNELSTTHQVLLSTHSPYLLNHFELKQLRRLGIEDGASKYYELDDLLKKYSSKDLHLLSETYGLKCVEPLLSNLVIVVEGPTDRTVLAELYELRKHVTVDAADILIVSAQGKDRVVKFCEILHLMKVKWKAVLDWDAVFAESVPHFVHMQAPEKVDLDVAVKTVIGKLDTSRKRGRNAEKNLQALLTELNSPVPAKAEFKGSALEKLLSSTNGLTASEQTSLKNALASKSVNTYRPLLNKANCWIWNDDLESELLRNEDCEQLVEAELMALGVIKVASPLETRRKILGKKLHAMANEPEKLAAVIDQLETNNAFSRSPMNICFANLFS